MPVVRIEKFLTATSHKNNPNMMTEYEFPIDANWEFPRAQLEMGETLGEGMFGRVVMAHANELVEKNQTTIVAVKMLREEHTDDDVKDLVCEMEIMKTIGQHVNIINLLGCCSQDGPLLVMVEYAMHGNLKDFLEQQKSSIYDNLQERGLSSEQNLISYASQVACGMAYLASRHCIHCNLAARKVLVCNEYVMKISDYGVARNVRTENYNKETSVKWMAPEAFFDKVFDSQSDM